MVGFLDGVLRSGWGKVVCGMVVMGLGVGPAMGQISLVETPVAIDPGLEAAGWMGIKLTLVADAASEMVGGIDLASDMFTAGFFPAGETIGITGPLHQAWSVSGGQFDDTAMGKLSGGGNETDSFFIESSAYIYLIGDPFAEDNNLAAGGDGKGFEASPLTDKDGTAYGVGSQMTVAAAPTTTLPQLHTRAILGSIDFAFLIVPAGGNDVYFRGVALDSNGGIFAIDQVLNPVGFGADGSVAVTVTVPEPGTVGVLGLGAVVLGRRRRGRS